jgi:hypothetical protein
MKKNTVPLKTAVKAALLLAAAVSLTLAGCGDKNSGDPASPANPNNPDNPGSSSGGGDSGGNGEAAAVYDPSGIWDFTISGQSFTVTLTGNTWIFDGVGTQYDDTGTFTRNGNAAELYWQGAVIGTAVLTSETVMMLTLVSPSTIRGTFYGTKRS